MQHLAGKRLSAGGIADQKPEMEVGDAACGVIEPGNGVAQPAEEFRIGQLAGKTAVEDFVKYAATQDFDARTAAQTALDQLIKAAQAEELYDNYEHEIAALQKKVNMDKETVLRAKKAEILPLVEQEIVTCYYFSRAAVPVSLRYDTQLHEAVEKWIK